MTSGIYAITDTMSLEQYIGKAGNIAHRLARHRAVLRKGTSPHRRLQIAWERDGEAAFRFDVIEDIPLRDSRYIDWPRLQQREREYIETLRPSLNGINWDPKTQVTLSLPQSLVVHISGLSDGHPAQYIQRLLYKQFQREVSERRDNNG